MKNNKTPMILKPAVIGLFLLAALFVCALAFRATEMTQAVSPEAAVEMARLQESRAYYEGRISAAPTARMGQVSLPPLPPLPESMETEPRRLLLPEYEAAPAIAETTPKAAQWKENAAKVEVAPLSAARIAIIIDDMGMDRRRTQVALTLPAPITFAWLPYAPQIQGLVDEGRATGHEMLVHMPMEPDSLTVDPGSTVLKSSMTPAELTAMTETNLSAFSGYVGFNNHMGSKLTRDPAAMALVMDVARRHGILFVDSRTSPDSVAASTAAAVGLPYAERDIFLDHYEDSASVMAALEELEKVARRKGFAIAIGHPKDNTMDALRTWLPTLAGKGLQLVPVSALVRIHEPAAGNAGSVEGRPVASNRPIDYGFVGPLQPPVSGPAPY
ncbi:MAG: divergent polysaccharide deacetylase family protein [Micavibrio aeruginosavorus]|uniref:Divergent polysaccharide deacetylase family protein n=1 Tax=Micavibrio aeruginosavorus TaxID=349221 RepID=A0A7T5R0N3_9BACT|nr:MAG: divergent polysaccharide deacetylase family protein [Micavibrio aeruginosavorus]